MDWHYDMCMPKEWREIVGEMAKYKNAKRSSMENIFRMVEVEEISQPQPFRHLYCNLKWVRQTQKLVIVSTILRHDKMDDNI